MFVVRAKADIDPDVVQQRRHLQEETFPLSQTVFVGALIEQLRGKFGDMATVIGVEAVFVTDGLGARQHVCFEVPRA
jgi:hypothetical protein